ncbi:hypothetical protein Pst134EA_015216 [Puccinia striiformis f. sp. tritici]|uniref:Uncharacterized protein n=1 Tax=Puccinia striiformis f. sp. tritici PST-78 TaxID=1165861 RepID=A0A0L0W235_9BASI|nr:hypothetical protein Pst134EA_015216 [Puccinia striiformis f. sp. tritici]KAH9463132.1 hypothetical protein Pst134EA_015216 [Puccinia striiformis f. sp. tritici]KNF05603.1 hypothetical protein PSTG_01412 [Puccinia striiformis f. sp. tritici PST-78]
MLGQLNPGQTRLPLASLDFGDRDLTDGFTDVRDETHSSISGFGHPRGSTPISALSSRRSTASTALSGESPESRRVLPNMSALLDFLDNDNTNPFPQASSSNRKSKKSGSHRSSRSPTQSSPTTHSHPQQTSLTPRPMPLGSDLPSNYLHTYDRSNPFRGALPTSSTPYTNHRDDYSEMSSPLNKRLNLPSGLQANLPPLQFSNSKAAFQTSRSPVPEQILENQHHHSPQYERHPMSLPSETPARLTSKAPSAADRMAAAVMEGAPESHYTFLLERRVSENASGIRRSKVLDEMLQPMRPSVSCPGKPTNPVPEAVRNPKDSDLPQSLVEETRRTSQLPPQPPPPSTFEPIVGRSRLTRSAGYSSSPNPIRPTPHRPPLAPAAVASAPEQVQVLDARVTELLSHIRSDQVEKANLISALTDARSEVAALRDEVRLLRIGVQKLEDRPHQSADARLERRRATASFVDLDKQNPVPATRPQQTSGRERRISLEALLNETTSSAPIMGKTRQINPSPHQLHESPSSGSNLQPEAPENRKKVNQTSVAVLPSHQEGLFQEPSGSKATARFTKDPRYPEPSSIKDLTQHLLGDLALGLTFTRCVDHLLMNQTGYSSSTQADPNHPQRTKFRADSDIFDPDNLERLFGRLKAWKQLVVRRTSSSHNHPPPPRVVPS